MLRGQRCTARTGACAAVFEGRYPSPRPVVSNSAMVTPCANRPPASSLNQRSNSVMSLRLLTVAVVDAVSDDAVAAAALALMLGCIIRGV